MGNFDYCVYCLDRVQCSESNWACTFDKDGFVCDNLNLPELEGLDASRETIVDRLRTAHQLKQATESFKAAEFKPTVGGVVNHKHLLSTLGTIVKGVPGMGNISKDVKLQSEWGEDDKALCITSYTNGVQQAYVRFGRDSVEILRDLCADWLEKYDRKE
jgi:hypothetical protein